MCHLGENQSDRSGKIKKIKESPLAAFLPPPTLPITHPGGTWRFFTGTAGMPTAKSYYVTILIVIMVPKILDPFPNNLPVQLTSFIGREKEIAQIKQAIISGSASPVYPDSSHGRGRLVTLTGPGGTGKTRLAMQVAAELLETFPDGIWLVELASLADPELIPQTILGVIRVHLDAEKSPVRALIDSLKQSKMLLILDNCEHVVDAVAQLAEQIQQGCPEVHILATSREILGTTGEVPIRVPSLSVPTPRHHPENFARREP